MQVLLSFYVQKSKAAGLGNKALPPASSAAHCIQWGLKSCQEKPSLVGDCYGLRVRPANNGRSDKSQGQHQFSSLATEAVRLFSVSWVRLRWDLDHKGQSYRRTRWLHLGEDYAGKSCLCLIVQPNISSEVIVFDPCQSSRRFLDVNFSLAFLHFT